MAKFENSLLLDCYMAILTPWSILPKTTIHKIFLHSPQYVETNGGVLLKDSGVTVAEAKEKMRYLVQAQAGLSDLSVAMEKVKNDKILDLDSFYNLPEHLTGKQFNSSHF